MLGPPSRRRPIFFVERPAAVLALPIMAAAIFLVPTLWGMPWNIDHFFPRSFIEMAAEHPMLLSYDVLEWLLETQEAGKTSIFGHSMMPFSQVDPFHSLSSIKS